MQPTNAERIQEIRKKANETALAWQKFIHCVDSLSKTMEHDADWVLGQLLPKTRQSRRDDARIVKWAKSRESIAIQWFLERAEKDEINKKREEIIKRIKLTPEEMKILNITPNQ